MPSASSAAQTVQQSTVLEVIARVGFVVLGIVHILIGVLAAQVAIGHGSGAADQNGAMAQVRSAPGGVFLLWVIALGLFALALWQISEAIVENDTDAKKRWGLRIKYLGTAVAYGAIAITAIVYAVGGSSDSSKSTETLSAKVMAAPGGVFLVGLIGLGIAAIGAVFVYRGVTKRFLKRITPPGGTVGKGITWTGVIGYIAKGIAIGAVGILMLIAAFIHDPGKAGGLDQGLRSLAELPFGRVILWAVGAGLVIYGVYCFARARYARM